MLRVKALMLLALMLILGICQSSFAATVTQVAAGYAHTVALNSDGTVWAWGYNSKGQLGDGTTTNRTTPVQVSGLSGVVAVSALESHTVALKSDGTVWAWGRNDQGQLGDGTTTNRTTPVQVSSLSGVTAVSTGLVHTAALKSDGTVWTWGNNSWGQLGDGTTTSRTTPIQVSGLSGVRAIAAGGLHNVALMNDGTVRAWGYNYYGQLGDGTTTQRTGPVQVLGLSGVTAIAAGWFHAAALKSDGTVRAWGCNANGQLGDGTADNQTNPVQVSGLAGVTTIAASETNTEAVKSDGTVWAWGNNDWGQIGDGSSSTDVLTPVQVSALSGVIAAVPGDMHTVALKSDGTVWAWGNNGDGQLGDGTTTYRYIPGQVLGLSGPARAKAVAAGWGHAVALKSDGTVWAWGDNDAGQLGDGTTDPWFRSTPVQALGISGVTAVAAGWMHTVALKSDGTVWAWGDNSVGQIGDGTTTERHTPVQASGLTGITAIAAAGAYYQGHTLALKSDGTVWAWGKNEYGQLGDGTNTNRSTPVQVSGLSGVAAVTAGDHFAVALKSDGTVWAWGWNFAGALGDGTTTDRWTPVQVSGLSGVTAVAAGGDHTVAIENDGTVWTWGYNGYGQLGNGAQDYGMHSYPVQVASLSEVTAIAGGDAHTVAVKSAGTVWAWGWNPYGQLGDGTTTDRYAPVEVSGLAGVTAVGAGLHHTVALKSDGTVWAWGMNNYGQLGDGTTTARYAPVQVVFPVGEPPTGSITVNGGSAYAATAAVTLTLSATIAIGMVSEMRISNDGVFDTEPWEMYATSKIWTLASGDGTKTVYVRFRSSSGVESDTVTDTIVLDTIPPSISSVTVSPSMAAAGDSLHVVVDATDINEVSSVTANVTVPLTKTGATTWEGDVTAASTPGVNSVTISAVDLPGNSVAAAGSYRTASIVCMVGISSLGDPILSAASSRWLFRMYGRVTTLEGSSFYVDDPSGIGVRVVAPGYTGVEPGNYVSARGILDPSHMTLTCRPEHVKVYP